MSRAFAIAAPACLALSACVVSVPRPADSANHKDAYYAVLGFGLIHFSVPDNGVHVERTTSVGFSITNSVATRMSAGFMRSTQAMVSTQGRSVRVDVRAPRYAPLQVQVEALPACSIDSFSEQGT